MPYVGSNTRRSSEDSSDISIDEDVIDGFNIFSDPESEWGMEQSNNVQTSLPLNSSSDSRPEVDQPSNPVT